MPRLGRDYTPVAARCWKFSIRSESSWKNHRGRGGLSLCDHAQELPSLAVNGNNSVVLDLFRANVECREYFFIFLLRTLSALLRLPLSSLLLLTILSDNDHIYERNDRVFFNS